MSIFIGALLCWAGLHDEQWVMAPATMPRCRRCGRHLLVLR